jgi:hypothetical protein
MTTKQDKQDEKDTRREERAEVKREEKEVAAHEKQEAQDVKDAEVQKEHADKAANVAAVERVAKQGRPTPTQAELDAIARGEHVVLAPDGSPPDGHGHPVDHKLGRKATPDEEDLERAGFKKVGKDAEPERGASYKTRQAHPSKED